MRKFLLRSGLLLFFLASADYFYAQCTVTGAVDHTTIPCGNCVTLSAQGSAQGNTAFLEDFNDGNPTGWQFTQTVTIGTNTCGVPSPDGTPFMWMGDASVNPRDMTTVGFDLSSGATICFEMRYSIQGDGSPCEGPDLPNEGVHLQYSTNNGASWIDIEYWDPNGGDDPSLTSWGQYCYNIPPGAQTTNTQIRWHQDAVSGADFDHWGIDNVEITVPGPPYQITWTHDGYSLPVGDYDGSNPTQVCLDSATTFEVIMANATDTCRSYVSVSIEYPQIDNIILDNPDCGNPDGSIQIQASGGIGGYQYSIDDSTTFQASNSFGGLDGATFYIVVKDQNDCHVRDTVQLFAVPPVIIVSDSIVDTHCGEDDGALSFVVSGGTPGYEYSIDNGVTYFPDSAFLQLASGSYTIVGRDVNGCTVSEVLAIAASTNPVIDSLDITPEMCDLNDGQIITYVSLGVPAYVYSLNSGTPQPGETFANLTSGSYTILVVDQEGCFADTTVSFGNTPAPIVPVNDSTLCDLMLQITGINSVTGSQWSSASSHITFSDPDAQNPLLTADQPGTYEINFQDTVCNIDENFTVVFVPDPQTAVKDTMICIGETHLIVALDFPQNDTYTWNTGATGTVLPVTETGLYIITAGNMCGLAIDTALIDMIACDLDVPNVFTPNGDGANDVFTLVFYEGIESFSCIILNRWGNVIREYNDVAFAWDGKDNSGNDVTEGTYFYVVKAMTKGSRAISKQGTVQVVRQ